MSHHAQPSSVIESLVYHVLGAEGSPLTGPVLRRQ
jgi:hypothetical protein